MTKEVVQEYIQHVIDITNKEEDYILSYNDKIFSPMKLITDGKEYSLLTDDNDVFASTLDLDSGLTELKINKNTLTSLKDNDEVIITNIENNLVSIEK